MPRMWVRCTENSTEICVPTIDVNSAVYVAKQSPAMRDTEYKTVKDESVASYVVNHTWKCVAARGENWWLDVRS